MQKVAKALDEAIIDSSEQNIGVLLKELNFEVLALVELARAKAHSPPAVAFIISTALMMLETTVQQTNDKARTAGAHADKTFKTAEALGDLTNQHSDHIADLNHRVEVLERLPSVLPVPAATSFAPAANTPPAGDRISALEAQLASVTAQLTGLQQRQNRMDNQLCETRAENVRLRVQFRQLRRFTGEVLDGTSCPEDVSSHFAHNTTVYSLTGMSRQQLWEHFRQLQMLEEEV